MTDKEKVLTVWPKAVAARSMFIDRAWMITVEGRGRISERFDNIEAAWQNAAESLPAQPNFMPCVDCGQSLIGCNCPLPAEPVAPVEAKEKERIELVCNKCGRKVGVGGSIKEGNGCNIGTNGGYRCAGIFESKVRHSNEFGAVAEPKPTPSASASIEAFCPKCRIYITNTTAGVHECPVCHGPVVKPQPDSSSISTEPESVEADYLLGRCLPLLDTLAHYGNKEAKEVRAEIAKYVMGLKGQSNGR